MTRYRPPFISQFPDRDGDIDDCQVAACLMLAASWTAGRILVNRDGTDMDTDDLRRLRVRTRDLLGPSRQAGGLTLDDLDEALRKRWPALAPLPRWTKPGFDLSFDELWARMRTGAFVAVLNGNAARTPKDSPMRRYAGDYGHAVYLHAAAENAGLVLDPLGQGDYNGHWVPKADLAAFLTAFGTPQDRAVALVRIGAAADLIEPPKAEPEDPCADLRDRLAAVRRREAQLTTDLGKAMEERDRLANDYNAALARMRQAADLLASGKAS